MTAQEANGGGMMPPMGARSWYEVLDVPRDASTEEIQDAYDRAIALLEGRAIGGYMILDPEAMESAKSDVETAFLVLSDPEMRAAFDAATDDDDDDPHTIPGVRVDTLLEELDDDGEPPLVSAELLPDDDMDGHRRPPTPHRPERTTGLRFLAPVFDDTSGPITPPGPGGPSARGASARGHSAKGHSAKGHSAEGARSIARPAVQEARPAEKAPAKAPEKPPSRSDSWTTTEPARAARVPQKLSAPQEPKAAQTPPAAKPPRPRPRVGPQDDVSEPVPRASAAKSNVRTLPPELAEALVEGSEVNGQVLRRLRESRGLSIDELSAATHIRKPYIIALEEMSLEELPARVYLRGFLTQIARVLKVDKKRLTDGYVEFAERFKL